MALKDIFKKIVKNRIDIFRWMGYPQSRYMIQSLLDVIKRRFFLPLARRNTPDSFQHMVQQFDLSELDLIYRQKQFERLWSVWLGIFVLSLVYSLYLALCGAWLSVISMLVLSAIILSQVFQYHFWSFQIIQRRCDCTVQEWWRFTYAQWWHR